MLWRGVITILLMCLPIMAEAQRTFPTRGELDSLVNPSLSKTAAGALQVDARHKNIGTIGVEDVTKITFQLRNTTSTPIAIVALRSSCICLKIVTKATTIEPNSAISIEARFSPEGRKGEFRYNILVYTDLDSTYPTERLTIEGEVENDDKWQHLPQYMGSLRLSRKEVTFASEGTERIAVANSSAQPLRLSAHTTLEGLTLRTEPEVIEPGKEGDIVITYRPQHTPQHDLVTMLLVEGVEASAMERMLKITIHR